MTDLANRKRLWIALSGLFLDTETRGELPRIALATCQSDYPWDEIDRIYLEEVAPVLAPNLLDVAGDWAGFPEDWLFAQIQGRSAGTTLISRKVTNDLHDEWNLINKLYDRLKPLTGAEQEESSRIWGWLASQFLHPGWPQAPCFGSYLRHLLTAPPILDFDWLEELYRPLWIYPGDPEVQVIQKNWSQSQAVLIWSRHLTLPAETLATILNNLQPLFLDRTLVPHHPVYQQIETLLDRHQLSPTQIKPWLDSPWADWIALANPRLKGCALTNWEQHF